MGQPFVYVGINKIKKGKLDAFKKFWPEHVELCKTTEPRLIVFHAFLNEQGSKVAIVQVHPDNSSMQTHMQVISQALGHAGEWLEGTESENVYGLPYEGMIESWKEYGADEINVFPNHVGGFTRSNASE
jgi:hypothetical protein